MKHRTRIAMRKTDEGAPPAPGSMAAAACLDPYLEAWGDLEAPADGSVADALRAAVDAHRRLIESSGLESEAPAEWEVRSEVLLEYRRSVDGEVLSRLGDAYRTKGPAARVEEALGHAAEVCAQRCMELPEHVTAPWPADALGARATDSFGRRAGKLLARAFSKARKTGSDRPLPLRAVALQDLNDVVTPGQDEAGAEALVTWAGWSRRLELLLDEWGRTALPALVRAEQPSDDSEQVGELWATIRDAATALQGAMEKLLDEDPAGELAAAARERLGMAREALEADLDVAGSMLLDPTVPPESHADLARLARLSPALRAWDEGVAARIALYLSLLSILSGATAVQRRMVWRFRDRCLDRIPLLSEIAERLGQLAAEISSPPSGTSLGSRLTRLDRAVEEALEPAQRSIPEQFVVDTALREISDNTIEALSAMIRQVPTSLALHPPSSRIPVGGRMPDGRTLQLQELARQSFDALRIERIRSSTAGLLEALAQVRGNVEDLGGVYAFAREEAGKLLEAEDDEDADEKVLDLIRGALRSTAEALRAQLTALDDAVAAAQNRLASEISDGSSALLDRVGAGRVEARLFAARSRVASLRAWINERWGPPVERAARHLSVRLARLRRLGMRAMRRGSEMVGSGPTETAASARTLRALADPRAATEGLPLVYQRLFTQEPVSDPALLAGREHELAEALRRWRRWHDDDGIPLVVRGRQGSGVTSFINVFASRVEEDGGTVVRSTFDERVTREAELAQRLASLLDLEHAPDTLDGLSTAIFDADPASLPGAVALDNLEHLYMRVPGGTDLMERLLTLMAETEPRIFWIGGVTASAWQLVATTEPTAISQVDILELQPLGAQAMRATMTARHRRSGLAIRYEEPTAGRHLLRRRLRRMRDPEKYQQVLEEDFFDRLQKASGGHLGLALHQWLVSADFTSGDGVLMHQPERPDFSVLEALDLTQNFTLKAFLEHRSLTLEEHDRIFRMSRQESYQIFESLRNRHLLEHAAGGEEDADARSEIEEELRYRVSPLLTGAVIAHLRGLNIVH